MRKDQAEGNDYDLISNEQWDLISKWYGGGPPIERRCARRLPAAAATAAAAHAAVAA